MLFVFVLITFFHFSLGAGGTKGEQPKPAVLLEVELLVPGERKVLTCGKNGTHGNQVTIKASIAFILDSATLGKVNCTNFYASFFNGFETTDDATISLTFQLLLNRKDAEQQKNTPSVYEQPYTRKPDLKSLQNVVVLDDCSTTQETSARTQLSPPTRPGRYEFTSVKRYANLPYPQLFGVDVDTKFLPERFPLWLRIRRERRMRRKARNARNGINLPYKHYVMPQK